MKNHADPSAQRGDIDGFVVNIFVVQQNLAFDGNPIHQIVHPVNAAQQRRFAATAGTNVGRDFFSRHFHVDAVQGLFSAIEKIEIFYFDAGFKVFALLRLVIAVQGADIDAVGAYFVVLSSVLIQPSWY